MTHQEPSSEPESFANKEAGGDRRLSTCYPSSDTPETDAQTRHSWMWDTRKMDYRPAGIVVNVDLARKLERERDKALAKLAAMEPLHYHEWQDGCKVIRCGEGEWRLEWCKCGANREKAESRKSPENAKAHAPATNGL